MPTFVQVDTCMTFLVDVRYPRNRVVDRLLQRYVQSLVTPFNLKMIAKIYPDYLGQLQTGIDHQR